MDAAQAGLLTQALEFVGVPTHGGWGSVATGSSTGGLYPRELVAASRSIPEITRRHARDQRPRSATVVD
jgi:hypothetical protein